MLFCSPAGKVLAAGYELGAMSVRKQFQGHGQATLLSQNQSEEMGHL
jgi:hypothetical protein